ncbi:OsmC family protein [Fodinibius sp.]|uniref:OsmC family protein n=1 Tax=Fodinibius sp. TaxID=1872440 RepID=UPI00356630C8
MSTTVKEKQNLDQNVIQAVQALAKEINSNPEKANVSFKTESKLEKGLQSEINVREFQFVSDEPESLGGTNRGATPVEYVLAALAACQEIVIKAHALALGINVKSVTVKTTGNLDLRGFLNLSDDARPGFNDVNLITEIETDETDEKKLNQLEEISFKNCPVLDIIENPVRVEGTVNFVN